MQRDCIFLASPLPARIPHPAELALLHPAPSPSPPAEADPAAERCGMGTSCGGSCPLLTPLRWVWPSHRAPPSHPVQAHPNLGRPQGLMGPSQQGWTEASPSPRPPKGTVAPACPVVPRGFGGPIAG